MTAKISTSCRSEDSKSIRANLLGWTVLCPVARELVKQGSIPLPALEPSYQTGEEYKDKHRDIANIVYRVIQGIIDEKIPNTSRVYSWREMESCMTLSLGRGNRIVVQGKSDIVVLVKTRSSTGDSRGSLVLFNVEVSSTKINIAKPYQVYFRSLSLYYSFRIPVAMIIISPYEIRYRHLTETVDIRKGRRRSLMQLLGEYSKQHDLEELKPASPSLCSLCELRSFCPHAEG